MANEPALQMLGLARRAGKLAFGEELVREACTDKKARCVMTASDAGESTAKKAAFYAERAGVPLVVLPVDKQTLGAAIGKNGCAVCAVTDIGLAAAAVQKLAAQDAAYEAAAVLLQEKNARIQSRKGKKKPKDRVKAPQAQPRETAKPAVHSARGTSGRAHRADGRTRPSGAARTGGQEHRAAGSRAARPGRKSGKTPRT